MNLRKYAKGKPCMIRIVGLCNQNPETVVLCHLRMAGITGTAQKSADVLGAWGCSDCHSYCEAHYGDRARRAFFEGIMRTQYQLIKDDILKW